MTLYRPEIFRNGSPPLYWTSFEIRVTNAGPKPALVCLSWFNLSVRPVQPKGDPLFVSAPGVDEAAPRSNLRDWIVLAPGRSRVANWTSYARGDVRRRVAVRAALYPALDGRFADLATAKAVRRSTTV